MEISSLESKKMLQKTRLYDPYVDFRFAFYLRLAWHFGEHDLYSKYKEKYGDLRSFYEEDTMIDTLNNISTLSSNLANVRVAEAVISDNDIEFRIKTPPTVPNPEFISFYKEGDYQWGNLTKLFSFQQENKHNIYLCPIYDNEHFTMLIIDYRKEIPCFYFQDSLGRKNHQLKQLLQNAFTEAGFKANEFDKNWIDFAIRQQHDGSSCGPFTIENTLFLLEALIDKEHIKLSQKEGDEIFRKIKQENITKVREVHAMLTDYSSHLDDLVKHPYATKYFNEKNTLDTVSDKCVKLNEISLASKPITVESLTVSSNSTRQGQIETDEPSLLSDVQNVHHKKKNDELEKSMGSNTTPPISVASGIKNEPQKKELSKQTTELDSHSMKNISMMVLGGFIAAVGIAAVAVAFTVLNAATLGIPGIVVASVGVATALVGVGLFATSVYKNRNKTADELANTEEHQNHLNGYKL